MYICSLLKDEMNRNKGFQIVFKNRRLINNSSYFLGRLVRNAALTISALVLVTKASLMFLSSENSMKLAFPET